jgi:hypothetical protein
MHISAKKISEETWPKIYIGQDPDPDVFESQKSSGSATLFKKGPTDGVQEGVPLRDDHEYGGEKCGGHGHAQAQADNTVPWPVT